MSRAMKDSGIPWIGEIPKGWDTLKIKQVMRNKSIKGFPNETVLSLYRDYGVVPKDSRDDNHNVTSEDTSSYKLVEIGDFVINKMKAWQGSMAVSQYRGIISPAYYICHFKNDGLDRRYIHYLLRNDSYKAEYMRLSTGLRVGQWDLNIDDFLSIPMVLPPVPEQQRIAEFLDRKCGEIDEAIALQEEFIEEL
jgi:type I restriction enzyme S subunit